MSMYEPGHHNGDSKYKFDKMSAIEDVTSVPSQQKHRKHAPFPKLQRKKEQEGPLRKKKADVKGFADSQRSNQGFGNISLLTSNLAQLKSKVFAKHFGVNLELRIFLIVCLGLSISFQIISMVLQYMSKSAKIYDQGDVEYDDDNDNETEEQRIKRRNKKIRQADRLVSISGTLAFFTTILNVVITTFAF